MKTDKEIIDAGNERFGVCPECGDTDGYLNVRKENFFLCNTCKTFWHIGSIFSSWMEEDEGVWEKNIEKLNTYRMVDAYYPEIPEMKAPISTVTTTKTGWPF